jgi:hypothetical protein
VAAAGVLGARPAAAQEHRVITGAEVPAVAQLSFDLIFGRHLRYKVGGLARLPSAPGDDPVGPSVYLTVTPSEILLFERAVARLENGRPSKGAVAACLPFGLTPAHGRPVRCLPAVRDRVVAALREEGARLRRGGATATPTALFVADQAVPFPTFLAAAYSAALGTAGAPPRLALAVQARGRVATVPFFLVPPHVVRLAPAVAPLMLLVHVAGGRATVHAAGERTPRTVSSLGALAQAAGDLRARDPDRTVAFVTADAQTTVGEVAAVLGCLRPLFPHLVLGQGPPAFRRGGAGD